MDRRLPWSVRLAALAVPRAARDTVVGDLLEEQATGRLRRVGRELLAIGLHHHLSCYHERSDALALLRLQVVALAGVLVLPLAGATVLSGAGVFDGWLAAGTVAFWRAAPAVAALAAGLWLGRAALPAPHLDLARLHALPLLVVALALPAPGAADGVLATSLLLAGYAVGAAGRRAASPPV